jgi:protein-S-isoprenylcysteine O-methyltransferase Ste14
MSTTPLTSTQESGPGPADIRESLRRLDRQDSWRWWCAVVVITLLMGAIVVLSLPKVLRSDDPSFEFQLSLAVRGVLALVLIFNVYTLYQQHVLSSPWCNPALLRGGVYIRDSDDSEAG